MPNLTNCHCSGLLLDYFVHYYHQKNESAGRSGNGGTMNPYETLLLRQHINDAWKKHLNESMTNRTDNPTIVIKEQEEAEFFRLHADVIEKVRTAKDEKGRFLYYPWREKSYVYPTTTDNILKMWNTINEAWEMVSSNARRKKIKYTRAAMLRIDVTYITPIDIWDNGTAGVRDVDNKYAIIPGFGRHPISDRMIYGPADAVKVWSAERFQRMDGHVKWISRSRDVGYGLHSERFVANALFPNIEYLGVEIVEHNTLCFLRARADNSIWISDCGSPLQNELISKSTIVENLGADVKGAVEQAIGRKCEENTTIVHDLHYESLHCPTTIKRVA